MLIEKQNYQISKQLYIPAPVTCTQKQTAAKVHTKSATIFKRFLSTLLEAHRGTTQVHKKYTKESNQLEEDENRQESMNSRNYSNGNYCAQPSKYKESWT